MRNLPYVLDASALLCVLFDKPGADHVAARLTGALVSAVTHSDVIAALIRRSAPAGEVVGMLADLDIEVVPVDRHQAELAGILRGTASNGELSPGDSACLALAATRRAVVVTCHRDWAGTALDVKIELAR